MTAMRPAIACPVVCLGAGRMGRGIAVAFAYAGHDVTMIDVKARTAGAVRETRLPTRLTKSKRRWPVFRGSAC